MMVQANNRIKSTPNTGIKLQNGEKWSRYSIGVGVMVTVSEREKLIVETSWISIIFCENITSNEQFSQKLFCPK